MISPHDRCIVIVSAFTGVLLLHAVAQAQQCVTTPPPSDAVVLLNGKDCTGWVRRNGQPAEWKVENGVMVARDHDVLTRQAFGDHQLHIEFQVPPKPAPDTQGNGNSGVYLHGFYEIQVIDSAGARLHKSESCGAVYSEAAPLVDASLPTGEWQSFDIFFQAPRLDSKGKLIRRARVSILHNGLFIHRDLDIDPTPGSLDSGRFGERGPLLLQYHGYPVRYRNIWVRRLPQVADGPGEMSLVLPGGHRMQMIRIPAGTFTMGTPPTEADREPDETQHKVTITRDFWMSKFEVTNAQFRVFRPNHVSGKNKTDPSDADSFPVTFVTWDDATAFCKWASAHSGWSVRLPTEAEWEYASRAGTSTRYSFGDEIGPLKYYARYLENSGQGGRHSALPVGQLRPNPWGLYDIHGNVAEWCQDWYGDYPGVPLIDPQGPPSGQKKVSREGSHGSNHYNCRAGDRDRNEPGFNCDALGFRVVCSCQEDRMLAPLPGGQEMEFVRIKAGTFMMGSPEGDPIREDDEIQHQVTLTKDYWVGKFEVTNKQFRAFRPAHLSGDKPDSPYNGDEHPVVFVTWDDATAFCKWASEKTGRPVRLPTEAEWEYAARAGTQTRYSFGDDVNELGKYAWYRTNVNGRTMRAGLLRPNPWGLYDVHGNAAEWCADWYGPYARGPATDPVGPASGDKRTSREGSGASEHYNCRVSDRDFSEPSYKGNGKGFRVVFSED
jgi:formylglycine-generating enzyme required for sulfatase activity